MNSSKLINKVNKLKNIISHIIAKNNTILDIVNKANKPFTSFIVELKNDCNSYGDKGNGQILLGCQNIPLLFETCHTACEKYNFTFSSENNYTKFETIDHVCIESQNLKESFLSNTSFLESAIPTPADILTISTIAYTLFHEFGHIKYDEDNMFQIEKERKADYFAMKLVKDICSTEPNLSLDNNPTFLGAFWNNVHILNISNLENTETLISHPHPIERLYILLEYFHIVDDSYLWEYAYDSVINWLNKHDMSLMFERESSVSKKDKLIDAYLRFKK